MNAPKAAVEATKRTKVYGPSRYCASGNENATSQLASQLRPTPSAIAASRAWVGKISAITNHATQPGPIEKKTTTPIIAATASVWKPPAAGSSAWRPATMATVSTA